MLFKCGRANLFQNDIIMALDKKGEKMSPDPSERTNSEHSFKKPPSIKLRYAAALTKVPVGKLIYWTIISNVRIREIIDEKDNE